MSKSKAQKRKFGFGSFCVGVACVVALGGVAFGIYKLVKHFDKKDTSQSEENKENQDQSIQATAEYKIAEKLVAGI